VTQKNCRGFLSQRPATATECADIAGMSPSACSYHLRALVDFLPWFKPDDADEQGGGAAC